MNRPVHVEQTSPVAIPPQRRRSSSGTDTEPVTLDLPLSALPPAVRERRTRRLLMAIVLLVAADLAVWTPIVLVWVLR